MSVAPSHAECVLPDSPDLLKFKLLLNRVLYHGEAAFLGRQRLGVGGVSPLLSAAGAGTLSAKEFGGDLTRGAVSPRDSQTLVRIAFDLGWHVTHRGTKKKCCLNGVKLYDTTFKVPFYLLDGRNTVLKSICRIRIHYGKRRWSLS